MLLDIPLGLRDGTHLPQGPLLSQALQFPADVLLQHLKNALCVRAEPEPVPHPDRKALRGLPVLLHPIQTGRQHLIKPVLKHLAVQPRLRHDGLEALLQFLREPRRVQTFRCHLKPFFLRGFHHIPLSELRLFGLGVPPGLRVTQAVLTEPHGLPHGEDRFHKVRLPAAQTDGTAEIAEQIPLLLNFLLDFGKALLQRYGPVCTHAQNDRNAFFPDGGGKDIRQGMQLPPDDLQRTAENDLIAVRIGNGANQIYPHHRSKADAFGSIEPLVRIGQKRLLVLRRVAQRFQQQILLAFLASLQLEFQSRLFPQLVAQAHQDPGKLLLLEGLEQIILHAVFQRILGIFKLPVTADDDKMQIRLQFLRLLDQLDPAAPRHPDIRDQQIRMQFPHQLQRPQTVIGRADDLISQTLPVNQLLQQKKDLLFVICQNDFQHGAFLRFC